ncbi:MAG: heavy-metal-associated domain-containing protein [Bacteroidales bacterium]|nr:heavy-metal-associated domain-containing protein [Bacteroidales bacterium]HOY39137.1 heavy-metal-associated domain-containing protein [Bacteroidales bacterium]HQP03742.1 heavy-metal-associated domain-containing protein [Bacteroidales bacterium]
MKKLALFIGFAFISMIALQSVNAMPTKGGNDKEVTLKVNMNCQACATKVEKQLAFTKGVRAVKADFEKDVVIVVYNSTKTDPNKLIASLKEIEYDAVVYDANAKQCPGNHSGCPNKKASSGDAGSGCPGSKTSNEAKPAGCAGQHNSGEGKASGCGGQK